MSVTKRQLLPRRSIRDQDNVAGKYPRALKTGDTRTGQIRSYFDDLNTPLFINNVTVSYPAVLPSAAGLPALTVDLQGFRMQARGRVNKGVIETWMLTNTTHDAYKPFVEIGQHEQDLNKFSATWLTGSSPSELGLGFAGGLGEKTKLRFEFPITTKTTLNPLTASVYYLNPTSRQFDEAGPTLRTDPNPNKDPQVAAYSGNDSWLPMDAKYFDPLGNYVMSGSHFGLLKNYLMSHSLYTTEMAPYKKFYYDAFTNTGVELMSVDDPLSALRHPVYAANSSQLIDLSGILTSPFLLEKATIELPFEAGPGWFNDRTQFAGTLGASAAGNTIGVGGPCITFAICNQITPTHRELIMSASIIPEGDNQGSTFQSTIPAAGNFVLYRGAKGFPTFGSKPTVVVPSGSASTYTGTLRFDSEARISNGVVYADILQFNTAQYAAWTPATAPAITYPTSLGGYVMFVNPIGRGGNGTASGRSIFGRDSITPKRTYVPYLQTVGTRLDVTGSGVSGSAADLLYKNGQGNAISPYLLMPTDKLVMVISKYHAAPIESNAVTSRQNFTLTSSHDVKVGIGNVRITLYGSQVRDQVEYHDTLNTDITSNAVHTIIGLDPVLDQWNVESRSENSGTYTDNIITGSLTVSPANLATRRGVIGSKSSLTSSISTSVIQSERLRDTYEIAGCNTTVQLCSRNERYWDSLLPSIGEIARKNGAKPWLGYTGIPSIPTIAVDVEGPATFALAEAGLTLEGGHDGDYQFSKSFPFVPEYLDLKRQPQQGKRTTANWYIDGESFQIDFTKYGEQLTRDNVTIYTGYKPKPSAFTDSPHISPGYMFLGDFNTTFHDDFYSEPDTFVFPKIEDAVKLYFGFGDLNTVEGSRGSVNAPVIQFAEYMLNDENVRPGGVRPIIRGWKYGILNGLETFSRCHFRRDHYGQFRDMLEQRLFGTFYETVGFKEDGTTGGATGKLSSVVKVRFIGGDGTQVDPASTVSSNLSSEATSSFPYFDGQIKNRDDFNPAKIGSTLIAPFVIS